MAAFKTGDRVRAIESVQHPDGERSPVEVVGTVQTVADAAAVYRKRPQYSHRVEAYRRKPTKYPAGSVVCVVLIDGERRPRNFHESQLTPVT